MKKILIGCAIFLALLLLIGVGGSFYVIKKLKDSFPDMKRLDAVEQQLVARDGEFDSEIMPLDGSISPEMLDRYVTFQRTLQRRSRSGAAELQALLDSDESLGRANKFRKLRAIVSGGLDVARASVEITGVADSLLLSTGLTRGECVYLTALVRYGAADFEAPRSDADEITTGRRNEGREKMLEVVDGFEEEVERRTFTLLGNQRRELRALDQLDARQEAWLASLESVLDDRPHKLSNLKGRLRPWQLEALEPRLDELRGAWPTTFATYFLDLLPRLDDSGEGDGINIEFD
ncbi:MAG TPA: hypothetical protein VGB13_08450 [Candidatus Krumholzibacteria bacterium]|jgi:hypothetical protein